MELRLLKYFWTVAEEKSFSKAAKVLHITQPTLSRQMSGLEKELGTPLFVRDHPQVTLTEEGLFLKKRSEEILQLTETTEQFFKEHQEQTLRGHFSIGCVEADNSDTLAMMVEELLEDYPEVTLTIESGTSDEIVTKLEQGLLDLALLLEPIDTHLYGTVALPREERWGILVAKESPLASKKTITAVELMKQPLLCSGRKEIQQLLADWAQQPFSAFSVVATYNLIFNIFALVEHQVGIALTIEGTVSNRQTKTVTFIPLEPVIQTKCVLVWKKQRMHTPVVKEVIRRFRDAFEA